MFSLSRPFEDTQVGVTSSGSQVLSHGNIFIGRHGGHTVGFPT